MRWARKVIKAAITASPDRQEKAMFIHPYIGSALARGRQREMLAYADQQRLARRACVRRSAAPRAAGLVKIIQRMTTGRQTAGLGAGGSAVHPKE